MTQFTPKPSRNLFIILFLISFLSKPLIAQSDAEVSIAETLMFTNELANYTDDTATRKVMNVVNSLYNTSYDLKDAFTGKGSASALNQSAIELTTSLAVLTGNPKLQKIARDMNEFNAAYNDLKSEFGSDMDATTSATMDGVALAVQGLILIDGLFTKAELTKGQLASKNYMRYANNLLNKIYLEYSTMPEQNAYKQENWQRIAAFEKRFDNYNKATAKQRLLVLKYITAKNVPEFATLQQWTKEIKSDYSTKGLDYILTEVDNLSKYVSDDHLKNATPSLNGAKANVLLFKINYSYKNGNTVDAEKYTEQLAAIAPYNETKAAINSAFEDGNYQLVASLSPVFFAHWMRSMNNLMTMLSTAQKKDIPNLTMAGKLISDDIAILGKGIIALARNGQYSNAASYMEQAQNMYTTFTISAKAKYLIATEYNPDAETQRVYFNHAKALIQQQEGKYTEAIQTIDSAIFYANANILLTGYTYRIRESKIDLLIMQKKFDQALAECASVERNYMGYNSEKNYDAANFKFMKALIFYNMGKYQQALGTLTALKAMNPNMIKSYLLEKEIDLALNDKVAAKQVDETLYQLYQKK